MPPYSTGHDHADPAPYAKGDHRMRYLKRAQSAASPRYDKRALPPGELSPGSLPPGVLPPGSLPPGELPDKLITPTLPPDLINPPLPPGLNIPHRYKSRPPPGPPLDDDQNDRPQTPEVPPAKAINPTIPPWLIIPGRQKNRPPPKVVTEPYVNHDDKMTYPKPAPPAAMPHLDNVPEGCSKAGGCNAPGANNSPQVPAMTNPGKEKHPKDGALDRYDDLPGKVSSAFAKKWMWPIACCPAMAFVLVLLCTAVDVGANRRRAKKEEEEEAAAEAEDEDEDEYEEEDDE